MTPKKEAKTPDTCDEIRRLFFEEKVSWEELKRHGFTGQEINECLKTR